jgi:hypothetical protein
MSAGSHLPSVYGEGVSDAEFAQLLKEVEAATAIERLWLEAYDPPRYITGDMIRSEVAKPHSALAWVLDDVGYRRIESLRIGDSGYSPSILHNTAAAALKAVGLEFYGQASGTAVEDVRLSVTSLIRSSEYQANLAQKRRKLTIDPLTNPVGSSHERGLAFDIDASGYYRWTPDGFQAVHPRSEDYLDNYNPLVHSVARTILEHLHDQELVNFVPELEGTQEACFHVCVHPEVAATDFQQAFHF